MPRGLDMAISAQMLPWDTCFFGFPVASVSVDYDTVSTVELENVLAGMEFRLAYIFMSSGHKPGLKTCLRDFLSEIGARRHDIRTTYRMRISRADRVDDQNDSFSASEITPAIENLAYESGWASRFMSDERLRPYLRPMYLKWLQNDFVAGKVFVRPSVADAYGMATVSVKDGIGKVGLVAVSAECRGKGYGTMLMNDVLAWLSSRSVDECEVVTQGANIGARSLYEKVGFKIVAQAEVWHLWRC